MKTIFETFEDILRWTQGNGRLFRIEIHYGQNYTSHYETATLCGESYNAAWYEANEKLMQITNDYGGKYHPEFALIYEIELDNNPETAEAAREILQNGIADELSATNALNVILSSIKEEKAISAVYPPIESTSMPALLCRLHAIVDSFCEETGMIDLSHLPLDYTQGVLQESNDKDRTEITSFEKAPAQDEYLVRFNLDKQKAYTLDSFGKKELPCVLDAMQQIHEDLFVGGLVKDINGKVTAQVIPEKTFTVQIHWDVCHQEEVQATSRAEAIRIARERTGNTPLSEWRFVCETQVKYHRKTDFDK